MKRNIIIDTCKSKLDVEFINTFLSESYWAKGRSIDIMQTCIDNSLNFGIYLDNKQIGYGRIVTDFGQFAYLMDLFIIEEHRGNGYAKKLMEYIVNFEKLRDVKVWRLATADAHKLYEKFGFKHIEKPDNLMEFLK